jgi:hypothetical protein
MDLKTVILQMLFKPKKVHSLPGRLRVHIPFLTKVDDSRKDHVALVSSLLAVPDEIESAEITMATGNVLLEYDAERITEDEVFDYVSALLEIVLKNRSRLQDLTPEKIPEAARRLEGIIKNALGRRLALDTDVEIPDDFLA